MAWDHYWKWYSNEKTTLFLCDSFLKYDACLSGYRARQRSVYHLWHRHPILVYPAIPAASNRGLQNIHRALSEHLKPCFYNVRHYHWQKVWLIIINFWTRVLDTWLLCVFCSGCILTFLHCKDWNVKSWPLDRKLCKDLKSFQQSKKYQHLCLGVL